MVVDPNDAGDELADLDDRSNAGASYEIDGRASYQTVPI
jgi:hypothetical protein